MRITTTIVCLIYRLLKGLSTKLANQRVLALGAYHLVEDTRPRGK
jgi:hypothetical protein